MAANDQDRAGSSQGGTRPPLRPGEHLQGNWDVTRIVQRRHAFVELLARDQATGAEVVAGAIGFQSEGGEIHFRKVDLKPLP